MVQPGAPDRRVRRCASPTPGAPSASCSIAAATSSPIAARPAGRGPARAAGRGDGGRRAAAHRGAGRRRRRGPAGAAARFCIESYFAELDARFDAGFDPSRSISADVEELTEPKGLLLVARLRGEPIGCGALKLHGRRPAEIKRMWVASSARGLGVGRRILSELEDHARRRGVEGRAPGDQQGPARRRRAVPLGGLRRGRGVQRRALRPSLVREAPRVGTRIVGQRPRTRRIASRSAAVTASAYLSLTETWRAT